MDCRLASYLSGGTIPTAVNIPHAEIVERSRRARPGRVTVVFCNGPQCPASSDAVNALLQAGWPAQALAYYRGGIHDWVTLGLPLTTRPLGQAGADPADGRPCPAVESCVTRPRPAIYTTEP